MNKKQRNLCPFCFHKSDKWEEYWYCPHCKELNSKEQDGKLPIKCPKCEKPVSESDINIKMRVCTNCKSIVPKEFDECDEIFPIAVVGPTRSGKTHFLTVMAHKLLEEKIWGDYWSAVRVIRQEIVTTMGVKKSTQRDDYLNFDEILYNPNTHDTLQGTDLDAKICSLLIELTYKRGVVNCFKEPWKKKKILLALSDTAGEGLNRQHWSEITDRYPIFNNHVKAVIAMVDPLELSKISDESKDKDLQT